MYITDAHNRTNVQRALVALGISVSRLYEIVKQADLSSTSTIGFNAENLAVARRHIKEAEKRLSWVVFTGKPQRCRKRKH